MSYVDLTVYLGKSNSKSLYVHNLSLNKKNKDKFYDYRKNMINGVKISNFENFRSNKITDYLEKFS